MRSLLKLALISILFGMTQLSFANYYPPCNLGALQVKGGKYLAANGKSFWLGPMQTMGSAVEGFYYGGVNAETCTYVDSPSAGFFSFNQHPVFLAGGKISTFTTPIQNYDLIPSDVTYTIVDNTHIKMNTIEFTFQPQGR